MTSKSLRLTLMIGPTVPVPAPQMLMESLESVEVTHSDEGRSGFQVTFKAGRSKIFEQDYPLLHNPLLKPFNRVILLVTLNGTPQVLMDGIITNQELSPGNEPGASRLSITGEDVSLMMDLEEKSSEHPAQDETAIALKIIISYAQYGLIPVVIPPFMLDPPIPIERIPVQQNTDLRYLQEIAGRYGYVFYVTPGPVLLTNTAYWGPPIRVGIPQKALSVNLGSETNVDSINFQHNSLAPAKVTGEVQDRLTNQSMPVQTFTSLRVPLASQPVLTSQLKVRTRQFRESGLSSMQAFARAQGMVDASVDEAVTATGELDAIRYGSLLQARGLVGLRGAGYSYDGFWYVKRVTHNIRIGEYKQSFTLCREGLGSLTPVVRT